MKKTWIFKLFIGLLCIFITRVVIGQTTYIWTGAGDGTNLANPTNYTPNGLPSGATQDTLEWAGETTTNLIINYLDQPNTTLGLPGTGFGSLGINLALTSSQSNAVTLSTTLGTSPYLGLHNINIASGAGVFTMGDTNILVHQLSILTRPSASSHSFVNNSTNPAIINQSVEITAGGSAAYTLDFSGSGNWVVNNDLEYEYSGGGYGVQVDGPGTVYWNADSYTYFYALLKSITINGGKLVLGFPFNDPNFFSPTTITINSGILAFAASQAQTFSNTVTGSGGLEIDTNAVALATNNTYTGGTVIEPGASLQAGTGGVSGSIGAGAVDDDGALIFNRSDDLTVSNYIYEDAGDTGSVIQCGSGTLTLLDITNSYTGPTIVSNGCLVVNGTLGGDLDVSGGTVIADGAGSIGSLTVAGNMNITTGMVTASLNEESSPSNSVFLITSNITYTGGTLKLLNYGTVPAIGDSFMVFSKPLNGGAGMTILSPGFSVANNLSSNGSVTVTSVTTSTATIAPTITNGQLNLAWPSAWTGLHLQMEMEPPGGGINPTNWITISGTDLSNGYTATLSLTNNVFYRLAP